MGNLSQETSKFNIFGKSIFITIQTVGLAVNLTCNFEQLIVFMFLLEGIFLITMDWIHWNFKSLTFSIKKIIFNFLTSAKKKLY